MTNVINIVTVSQRSNGRPLVILKNILLMKSSVQGCQQSYCLIVTNYSQLVRFSKNFNHYVAAQPLEEFSWFEKKKAKLKILQMKVQQLL